MAASSRETKSGAGWGCPPGRSRTLMEKFGAGESRPFSWLSPVPLWQTRNDIVARLFGDPTDALRRAWMRRLAPAELMIDRSAESPISFLVMDDTGEGDGSQWATVPPRKAVRDGTAFAFVCSDVIYPAGGVNEYRDRFFDLYHWYGRKLRRLGLRRCLTVDADVAAKIVGEDLGVEPTRPAARHARAARRARITARILMLGAADVALRARRDRREDRAPAATRPRRVSVREQLAQRIVHLLPG